MTMITPSYLGETIEYSSLHACRSTLEDPTGLGLSLVAAYAVAIGASVRASLDGRQIFTVVTTFPPAIGESDSAVLAPAASQPSKDHAARGG